MRSTLAVAAIAIGLLSATVQAQTSVQNTAQTTPLTACVNSASGLLRVLVPGARQCGSGEFQVQLNQGGGSDSGTEVVDSKGNLVGRLIVNDVVLRQVNGFSVTLPVDAAGFKETSGLLPNTGPVFITNNCSGQPYIPALAGNLVGGIENNPLVAAVGVIRAGVLYFAMTAPQQIIPFSFRQVGGSCGQANFPTISASPADQQVDLTSFGLIPPFSVK